ncbi:MAG: ABC transporter permease [Chloroflexi bacterium]|nr:ABC transporter permease [Chloroflexota bacterium]
MRPILTIALREITRLQKRFSGGASPLTVVLLLGALALSAFAFREMSVLGNGLYRVGVSPDAPAMRDNRFAVVATDATRGKTLLEQHALDAYIDGARVRARRDNKSLYAVGALKRYLEKQELGRIYATYELTRAFPLRVEINYLDSPTDAAPRGALDETLTAPPTTAPARASDAALQKQLEKIQTEGKLSEIRIDAASDKEIIIPSLMTPPAPFAQVIVAFLYIMPVTFISIFFTSSFMDEKINRRLTLLLSAPVTPFQIILGKMLPYAIFALIATAVMAIITRGNVLLALAIFIPTILFILAIYLMVPLFYRTFKDTTFISMLATTTTTAFLVFPAMFTGISDLAFMSPLTLAVKMYRNEPFGWQEYLFPSVPMVAIFGLALYAGTRLLNEEFLMGFRPITRKIADGIFLVLDRAHPYLSIALMSLLVIPVVYLMQLVLLAIATNLPTGLMLGGALVIAATIEEVAKSAGIAVFVEQRVVRTTRQALALAFLSALGFLVGEKLLLLVSVNLVSQTMLSTALFNTGFLLVPLAAHFVFTSIVVVLHARWRVRYPIAILVSVILHAIYNALIAGGLS